MPLNVFAVYLRLIRAPNEDKIQIILFRRIRSDAVMLSPQYSSASMMVSTRAVTVGSNGLFVPFLYLYRAYFKTRKFS